MAKESVDIAPRHPQEPRIAMSRGGTFSAVGYGAHADRRHRGARDRAADLVERIKKLETSR